MYKRHLIVAAVLACIFSSSNLLANYQIDFSKPSCQKKWIQLFFDDKTSAEQEIQILDELYKQSNPKRAYGIHLTPKQAQVINHNNAALLRFIKHYELSIPDLKALLIGSIEKKLSTITTSHPFYEPQKNVLDHFEEVHPQNYEKWTRSWSDQETFSTPIEKARILYENAKLRLEFAIHLPTYLNDLNIDSPYFTSNSSSDLTEKRAQQISGITIQQQNAIERGNNAVAEALSVKLDWLQESNQGHPTIERPIHNFIVMGMQYLKLQTHEILIEFPVNPGYDSKNFLQATEITRQLEYVKMALLALHEKDLRKIQFQKASDPLTYTSVPQEAYEQYASILHWGKVFDNPEEIDPSLTHDKVKYYQDAYSLADQDVISWIEAHLAPYLIQTASDEYYVTANTLSENLCNGNSACENFYKGSGLHTEFPIEQQLRQLRPRKRKFIDQSIRYAYEYLMPSRKILLEREYQSESAQYRAAFSKANSLARVYVCNENSWKDLSLFIVKHFETLSPLYEVSISFKPCEAHGASSFNPFEVPLWAQESLSNSELEITSYASLQ